jgi:hypothetical protein
MTMTTKPRCVTLRVDDAILAFGALRSSIERDDRLLARQPEYDGRELTVEFRAEQYAAYERMAKALGLRPTLSTKEPDEIRHSLATT